MAKETNGWRTALKSYAYSNTLVGVEHPKSDNSTSAGQPAKIKINGELYIPNCYPVEWIDNYWSPKLHEAIKRRNTET